MKSEPQEYSIDDLGNEPNATDYWDGIRNYQVRNFIRDDMRVGDLAFFYHSVCKVPGVVGIMKIVREAYPDHTAFDPDSKYYDPKSDPQNPRWLMVDVQLVEKFPRIVSLAELRAEESLTDMLILRRGNRLSITPIAPEHWERIIEMSEQAP